MKFQKFKNIKKKKKKKKNRDMKGAVFNYPPTIPSPIAESSASPYLYPPKFELMTSNLLKSKTKIMISS